MRQVEALRIVHERKSLWLGMAVRGQHQAYDSATNQTIPPRVWERLLDLGDLEVASEWGGTNEKFLVVTDQGRKRLGIGGDDE